MNKSKIFMHIMVPMIVIIITLLLFIIPFSWLKPGFIDLGGDGGRLYFIDPLNSVQRINGLENFLGVIQQALIPYEFFLYCIKLIVSSPTYLINISNGITLSLAFLFTFLVVRELLTFTDRQLIKYRNIAALSGGVIYISFVSNTGWSQALYTQNQIFLNPLIFYLLLKLCISSQMKYGYVLLGISLLFSGSFGFAASPQLMSFFPLAFIFLYLYLHFIARVEIPWKKLLLMALMFFGLHAFHLLPLIATIFGKSTINTILFSSESISSRGVNYFDANHIALGKLSWQLFAPSNWGSQNFIAIIVPIIAVLGFVVKRSKLLFLTGIFFVLTLFLATANITKVGVQLYHTLFYIPGFSMFRSFNDRWYYVYAFFYTLLFAFSFYALIKKWKFSVAIGTTIVIIGITIYRIFPFLQGKALYEPLYQTSNVTPVIKLDPNMMNALEFTRKLPHDGKVLTVPLTFPYYQIAYGIEGGAYRGISLVANLAGHTDYSGFWSFGKLEKPVFEALQREDMDSFLSLLKQLEVKYIFRNSDPRIMDDFPGYPYVFPGMTYSSKDQLPIIKDQKAYDTLVAKLPVTKIYEKGFYSIYEFTGWPGIPQSTVDPALHPYFVIGRFVSATTIILIIGYIIRSVRKRKYEKNQK